MSFLELTFPSRFSRSKKYTTYLFFFLVLLSTTTSSSFTLDPNKKITQYILDTWNIENGLPQNTVSAVLQTRGGGITALKCGRFETSQNKGEHGSTFSGVNSNPGEKGVHNDG